MPEPWGSAFSLDHPEMLGEEEWEEVLRLHCTHVRTECEHQAVERHHSSAALVRNRAEGAWLRYKCSSLRLIPALVLSFAVSSLRDLWRFEKPYTLQQKKPDIP
jgi:hypothetical protein